MLDNQIGDEGAGILAGVLPKCPALSQLWLVGNQISAEGAGRLERVLPQSPKLCPLVLHGNQIGAEGAGILAGVLPQCPALVVLLLKAIRLEMREQGGLQECCHSAQRSSICISGSNQIGAEVAGRLRAAWRGPQSHLLLRKENVGRRSGP